MMPDSPGDLRSHQQYDANEYRGSLGVHTLSEFVFCHRAGIIASEQRDEQREEEPRLGPRLDFMAMHEHELIETRERYWQIIRFATPVAIIGLLLIVVALILFDHWVWASVGFIPALWGLSEISFALPLFNDARKALNALERAESRDDLLKVTETVRVDWWTLRRSGFDCQKLIDRLDAPDNSLGGKPWRVLVTQDNCHIPVIWRPRGVESYGISQAVRLAAYARLLEECHNTVSPVGVIFYLGTTECDIVPISTQLRSQLTTSIGEARRAMTCIRQHSSPPPQPTDRRCQGCCFGQPRRFKSGISETQLANATFPAIKFDGYRSDGSYCGEFHSTCGDRFQWTPPHDDAIQLQWKDHPNAIRDGEAH